ncbi:MAG: hypothetical protein LUH48_03705, partial [Clostridiales bacterium]|nr:hypothetical protein [Clostridiales bacterium]
EPAPAPEPEQSAQEDETARLLAEYQARLNELAKTVKEAEAAKAKAEAEAKAATEAKAKAEAEAKARAEAEAKAKAEAEAKARAEAEAKARAEAEAKAKAAAPADEAQNAYDEAMERYQAKDYDGAFTLFEKAAQQGHALAQDKLGTCYNSGCGVTRDTAKAFYWYEKAFRQDIPSAYCHLGNCYAEGWGTAKDEKKAIALYEQAMAKGYKAAQYMLEVLKETMAAKEKAAAKAKAAAEAEAKAKAKAEAEAKAKAEAEAKARAEAEAEAKAAAEAKAKAEAEAKAKAEAEAKAAAAKKEPTHCVIATYMYGDDSAYYFMGNETYELIEVPVGAVQDRFGDEDITSLVLLYMNGNEVVSVKRATDESAVQDLLDAGLAAYHAKEYDKAFPLLRGAAEQGNAKAQFYLGVCYDFGRGVKEDKAKAAEWYEKAALQGHANAQFNLGICYKNGEGVTEDKAKAVQWFEKAARQGNAKAQCNLGNCYDFGKGVEKDKAKAVYWYEKAADQGYARAQYCLGACYEDGEGVLQNIEKAIELYEQAEVHGFKLSKGSLTQTIKELKDGAEERRMSGPFVLGFSYYTGQNGLPKDLDMAIYHLSAPAKRGDVYAQLLLATCYLDRNKTPQDGKEALAWFEKASEQGSFVAQYDIGCMYAEGRGVRKNLKTADAWFDKAVDTAWAAYINWKNLPFSKQFYDTRWNESFGTRALILLVAYCYASGYRVRKNEKKAVALFEKVCNSEGEWLYDIAELYDKGCCSMAKSWRIAKAFYEKARQAGWDDQKEKRGKWDRLRNRPIYEDRGLAIRYRSYFLL